MDLKIIEEKLTDYLNGLGYELYDLKFKKSGDYFLEVIVDRVKPIDLAAIEEVSRLISSYLDEINLIDVPYMLDVSSLGAEKPLKIERLKDYKGQYVNIHLINPYKGENILEGTLNEVDDEFITLEYKVKTRVYLAQLEIKNIYKARLAIKF